MGVETDEMDKVLCYESIRKRLGSVLANFLDEELEEGIKELKEELKNQTMLKVDVTIRGLIIT